MELPTTPPPMRRITGEQGDILAVQRKWFRDILKHLGYTGRATAFVTVRDTHLSVSLSEPRASDDTCTLLVVNNHIVASVLQWRDDWNYVGGYFALYLTDETTLSLRKAIAAD